MTAFEADWICPVSSKPLRNGRLVVEHGRISEVGAAQGEAMRFPGCAIIPGFVNAHTHLELTVLRGCLEDLSFQNWIRRLTRIKYQHLTRDEILTSARLGAAEMLLAGVTCVGEVMDVGPSWTAMQEFELQGVAYQEVFGPAEAVAEQELAGLRQKIETHRKDETESRRLGVSPHAPFTVSSKLFRLAVAYARQNGLPITIHAAESKEEGDFVRNGAGPFADGWRQRGITVSASGVSPVSYLDSLGAVSSDVLLIHCIDVDQNDLEILRTRAASVVHCPKSNAKLAQGIARVDEMRTLGVTLGLGTDSVASNNVVDMFEEMRAAIFQQRGRTGHLGALDANAAIQMATLDGAKCLGLSSQLGSLDVGKRADFVVVNLNDVALQPIYDPIQTMVYSASRSNVKATFVGGRQVQPDTKSLVHEAQAIAQKLSEIGDL